MRHFYRLSILTGCFIMTLPLGVTVYTAKEASKHTETVKFIGCRWFSPQSYIKWAIDVAAMFTLNSHN